VRAGGSWRRLARDPLFGGAIAIFAALVLCWPLVSSPSIGVAAAGVYFYGAWAALIALLVGIARALRPASRRPRG
jgi:hypothetical protein